MTWCLLAIAALGLAPAFASAGAKESPPAPPFDPFWVTRAASPGAWQWGVELLRLDKAWQLTRGRSHLAIVDGGLMTAHEDLLSGIDGNLRLHVSQPMTDPVRPTSYHAMMVAGVVAARGFNNKGIAGACPQCALSMHNWRTQTPRAIGGAIEAGAVAVNMSFGGFGGTGVAPSCANGGMSGLFCTLLLQAEERDVVLVSIAGNQSNGQVGWPGNFPTVIAVGGVQPGGVFWTETYNSSPNSGSAWGAEMRLVAPARDVLTTIGGLHDPTIRCGARIDSFANATLPAEYAGYGDCLGTSFAAPWVTGIAGLVRSANPLLTAAEVRAVINETATRPVAGPAASGMTFYLPDAEAAVRRALGPGARNRLTPMFALYSADSRKHLFTSSPQAAVAAIAGELPVNGLAAARFASVGDPVPGYARFSGRTCAAGACTTHDARMAFQVFSTSGNPEYIMAPLYRMTQVCASGPACATARAFAYAALEADVRALEARGYVVDGVEGFIVAPGSLATPEGTRALCLAYDAQRIDHILYSADTCDRTSFADASGASTGGSYAQVAKLGYVPVDERALHSNYTGLWWKPDEAGWGVNFAHQGDLLFATLFTYDTDRRPMWLVMSGGQRSAGGTVFTGPLYRTTGPPFPAEPFTPVGPGNVTPVGEMRVTFASQLATLEYDVGGVRVTKTVQRQVFGPHAASCISVALSRKAVANYQDLWWNPAESGWGINLTHQGDVIFATLFTYGTDGKATWMVMSEGRRQADGSFAGDLYRTAGSPFNANPVAPTGAGDVSRAGNMRLTFTDGENAALAYSIDGVEIRKSSPGSSSPSASRAATSDGTTHRPRA